MKANIIVLGFLLVAAVFVPGCSTVSDQAVSAFEPRPASRTFDPLEPTAVTGRVIELKAEGAWIDFDDAFISYSSVIIELAAPAEASGKLVYLQYQGQPVASGRNIRLGQVVTFTLPVMPPSGCCEPYLDDIADIRLLPDGR